MHLLRILKIKSLKMRLLHIANYKDDAIEEKYKISTTIWHPRTWHVGIFLGLRHPQSQSRKVETPGMSFEEGETMHLLT